MIKRRRNLRPLQLLLTAVLMTCLAALCLQACGDERVVDQATVTTMEADEFRELLSDATDSLIGDLGGDEAGFYAVLLALDQGYDIYQLLTGSLNGRIDTEGRITGADGSRLAPARAPEGIIEPASENSEHGTGRRAAVSVLSGLRLASVSSPPLLLANSALEPRDRTAELAQGCGLGIIHAVGKEMLRERELEQQRARAERQQALEAEEQALQEQVDPTEKWDFRITAITVLLGARGYSAKQVMEAILLDSYRFKLGAVPGVDPICHYIEYSPGVMLRPAYPPVDILGELTCPGADSDAPTEFPAEDVQAAVARANASYASSDEAQATTTTVANPDIDGIKDGLYVGEVFVAGEARTLVDEIVESTVELDITDEGIVAVVEYVHRYSAVAAGDDTTCMATFRILYSGQGPVTSPLSLVLEPVEGEIISLEGKCGDMIKEGIHSHLAAQGLLAGTFEDGVFTGQLDVQRGVRASIAE